MGFIHAVAVMGEWPGGALANAGTPLMWAGAIHLLFGNAIIGVVEGVILARVMRARMPWAIAIMILANYFSAWVGWQMLGSAAARRVPWDLYNAWRFAWIMAGVAYGMTVLLEWPFVAWCMNKGAGRWRRSAAGSLLVQTATYLPLLAWYWSASGATLYTEMNVVRPAEMPMPAGVAVYFIAAEDGSVQRLELHGGEVRRVLELKSRDGGDRLLVREASADAKTWDLVARLETGSGTGARLVVVREGLAGTAAVAVGREEEVGGPGTWMNFGPAKRLGSAGESDWEVYAGIWPVEGLRCANRRTGEDFTVCLELPHVAWAARNATHLPGDLVLFQLGEDQICLLEIGSRRIARVARGRGPVVVMESAAGGQ